MTQRNQEDNPVLEQSQSKDTEANRTMGHAGRPRCASGPNSEFDSRDGGQLGQCDACGALVPIESLSLVIFTGLEGFGCEACLGDTVVVTLDREAAAQQE